MNRKIHVTNDNYDGMEHDGELQVNVTKVF